MKSGFSAPSSHITFLTVHKARTQEDKTNPGHKQARRLPRAPNLYKSLYIHTYVIYKKMNNYII